MNIQVWMRPLLVVALWMTFVAPLPAEEKETDAELEPDQKNVTYFKDYALTKWSNQTLLYKTQGGRWLAARKFVVADQQGAFLNQGRERVPYRPGDILFKTRRFGWYKAHPLPTTAQAAPVSTPAFPVSPESLALIDAVRSTGGHSVDGKLDPKITQMAMSYAQRMARQGGQDGHAGWNERFHSLIAQGHGAPGEITAQSWGSEGSSLDAHARSCVQSWLQSPGHRAHVMRYRARYGYAMARGSNGVYYAVGIFAD